MTGGASIAARLCSTSVSPRRPPSPEQPLNCLLVQPRFSVTNYWNLVESARAIGAKAMAAPLGLMTVAALLPSAWKLRLVDLNVRELTDQEWDEADLVCVGGMLPQQTGILEIIERARRSDRYVVVGGPDPTSQPALYERANALVLGEGEVTIPRWLESWRQGRPDGVFTSDEKPDMTLSPLPRFDLVNFNEYLHVGVQFSRGCPFNCEFCDIIELFGRRPRAKTPGQFTAELESLYQLGYRGWVDIADDNFIGNKRLVKEMLREMERWSEQRNYPFFYSTEATINLADDPELMEAMRNVDFRYVFIGIETPDPELLRLTQKRVNTMTPVVERIHRIYGHGMAVSAGFILGFDGEKPGNDQVIISCIEQTGIMLAMVGLLSALPNTQLTRRLRREGRLISSDHEQLTEAGETYHLVSSEGTDQTGGGLNFVTSRDRVVIYEEMIHVARSVYDPQAFMDRVWSTTQKVEIRRRHRPEAWELKRMLRGLRHVAWRMTLNPQARGPYWRTTLRALRLGPDKFEFAQTQMGSYLHFEKQSGDIISILERSIDFARNDATYPREVQGEPERAPRPVGV